MIRDAGVLAEEEALPRTTHKEQAECLDRARHRLG